MNNLSKANSGGVASPYPEMAKINLATSFNDMDEGLKILQANKDKWVITAIDERISILDEIRRDLIPLSAPWIALSIEAKGVPQHSFGEGEEWIDLW